MELIIANKEWIFSGIGIFVLSTIARMFFSKKTQPENKAGNQNTNNIDIKINQDHRVVDIANYQPGNENKQELEKAKTLEEYKDSTRILFVDDDTRFKVVKILSRSGWVHTKLVKDCDTLDDVNIINSDILFIDVQGVGVAMGFNDEGLGLALAIKQKYPLKKVIIYSAETKGDRFHEALRKADYFLAKNADPYEFQKIVEDFTIGVGVTQ